MGKHDWRDNDFLVRPAAGSGEDPTASPRPPAEERPAGARRFLFYGLLAGFGLLLAAAAAWLTLDRLGGKLKPLEPVTLVLVGIDERQADVGRTDTIILVSYNPAKKQANVVWVPRDTRVIIPGYSYHQKINAAYALGGIDLTRRTIEDQLGVKVDHHVLIDFKGFADVVDALGGVTVNVPKQMDYDDRAQDLHIHLTPGEHRLSGNEALGFVRYRSDGLGDISLVDPANKVYEGRVTRQQEFVQSVVRELLKPANLWRLPTMLKIVSRTVETDMPLGEILAYVRSARTLTGEEITTATLPGEGQTLGGVSYWVPENGATEHLAADQRSLEKPPVEKAERPGLALPDLPKLKKGLAKVVAAVAPGPRRPLPPAKVVVLNGTGEPGLATRAASLLRGNGLEVVSVGNAGRYQDGPTRVVDLGGREDAVAKVKKLAPQLQVVEKGTVGLSAEALQGNDLVVLVGSDFAR